MCVFLYARICVCACTYACVNVCVCATQGLVVLSKNGSIVHLPLPDAYGEDHGAELVASGEAQPPSTLMSFHHGPIRSIACLPDERPIVFTAGEDKRVLAYDYANNRIEVRWFCTCSTPYLSCRVLFMDSEEGAVV